MMIRIALATLFLFTGSLAAAYPGNCDMSQKICFVDLTQTNAPWANCWSVATDLSSMLDVGLKTSPNEGLHSVSPENVHIDLLEYSTSPLEIAPKSAVFPADSYRCPTRLRIVARLKIVSCTGEIVHEETVSSSSILDDDGKHYDYCKIHPQTLKFPCTPLAKVHGDFIRTLLARFDLLQRQRML